MMAVTGQEASGEEMSARQRGQVTSGLDGASDRTGNEAGAGVRASTGWQEVEYGASG